MWSEAEVNGQPTASYGCIYDGSAGWDEDDCLSDLAYWDLESYYEGGINPPASGSHTLFVDGLPWDAQWSTLAVTSRVLWLGSWNYLASCPILHYEKPFGAGGTGVIRQADPSALPAGSNYISSYNSMNRPWTVAHEVGHQIAFRRENGENAGCGCGCDAAELNGQIDICAPMDGCDPLAQLNDPALALCPDGVQPVAKGLFQKEFAATAAREGWADFVAVATFNDGTDTTCVLNSEGPSKPDIDLDALLEDNGDTALTLTSCDPTSGSVPLDATLCAAWDAAYAPADPACNDNSMASYLGTSRDYLDDMTSGGPCTGSVANRSTQHDWLRFWWAMHTVQGISLTRLALLLDNMDQRDWDPDDNGAGSDGLTSTSDDVLQRLTAAKSATICILPGTYCTNAVNVEDDHGQDH